MDIDYATRKNEPEITETNIKEEKVLHEQWERSNRLSIMFIKTSISVGIRGSIEQHTNVRALLKAIDEQFATSDKARASTLIMKFSSLRFTNVKGVCEHIMEMRDIAAQLKALEVDMSETFLVHYILNTLPQQYGPFKISYNTHKDKWSINELFIMCVQDEGNLLMEQEESAMLVTEAKYQNQGRNQSKNQASKKGKNKVPPHGSIKKESKCFFCKKKRHVKEGCAKFKKWLKNKVNSISCVCYESNIADGNHNTWWIDSRFTIHILNTLQGMRNLRKPMGSEQNVLSGNKVGSHVESIRTCSLVLDNGYVLDLERTFYIPIFSRNLISVSRLVPLGYSFKFLNYTFSLFCKFVLTGNGVLSNGIFSINLQYNEVLHTHIGNKQCIMNEDSSILWHLRLGHISIDRIKRLVNEKSIEFFGFY